MINKKSFFLITALIFAGLLILVSCSSITVNSDYNTQFDFSKWKTFGFIPIPESAGIERSLDSRAVRRNEKYVRRDS